MLGGQHLVVLMRILAQRAAHTLGKLVEGAEAVEVVDLVAGDTGKMKARLWEAQKRVRSPLESLP